jgi:tetratricopeptide (TPR) repeat protein
MIRVSGATEQDQAGIIRERLQQLVDTLLPEQAEAAMMVFRTLLGLEIPGDRPKLAGEAFKGRLFVLMSTIWQRLAQVNPLILVCEDLHWIDAASAELLRELFPICLERPMLLVCAARPDRQTPAWDLKQFAEREYAYLWQEIQLQPLGPDESGEMIDNLLQISELPQSLLENIKDKSEGNPFYVEEVVRTLIDRGFIVPAGGGWERKEQVADIEIPNNLQSLLIARIDRLDSSPRSTLQRASILGRAFYQRVLAYVQQSATALNTDLEALQQNEFLLVSSRIPELEYLFRHALMQDAAYSTILLKERRRFHRKAAAAYEAIFPDRLDELSAKIARHYLEAREYGPAGKFFRRAGDLAFRIHASHEAAQHYRSALDCSQRMPISPGEIIHLNRRLGRSYELSGDFDLAMETYLQLEQIGRQENQPRLVLWSLVSRAVMHATWTPFADSEKGEQTGRAAIALAEEMGDPGAEARAHWSMMLLYFFHNPNPEKARLHGESSLGISRSHGLVTQQGYTLNDLVRVYMNLFEVEKGLAFSLQAKKIFEELGELPMLADNLNFAANLYILRGELDKAKAATLEAGRIASSIGNIWNQSTSKERAAIIHLEAGEYGESIRNAEEAMKLGQRSDLGLQVLYASVQLALVYAELGDYEKGLKVWDDFAQFGMMQIPEYTKDLKHSSLVLLNLLSGQEDKARKYLEKIRKHAENPYFPISFAQYPMPFMACEIFLADKEYQRTLDFIDQLLHDDRLANIPIALPEFGYYRSRALYELGRTAEAREILVEAQSQSRSFGTRRLLWKILGLLARIEGEFGDIELAAKHKAEAAAVIESIAAQPGLEDLRQTFLSLPEVREIIG